MVKYYDASPVEDLGLTMSVAESNFGITHQIPLVPFGEQVPVTNENR
jgi:hypothetical protein